MRAGLLRSAAEGRQGGREGERCVSVGMSPARQQYVRGRDRQREWALWMPTSVFLPPILLPTSNELTADGTPSVSPLPPTPTPPHTLHYLPSFPSVFSARGKQRTGKENRERRGNERCDKKTRHEEGEGVEDAGGRRGGFTGRG